MIASDLPLMYDRATGQPRSPKWRALRQEILLAQPWCSACGGGDALEVHHVAPFHLRPELELNTANLIVLCESPTHLCHWIFGHRAQNWGLFDPDCVELVQMIRRHLDAELAKHHGPLFPRPE